MIDIADYIACFYNPVRLHFTLGYRSPNERELPQLDEQLYSRSSPSPRRRLSAPVPIVNPMSDAPTIQ